MSVLFPVATTVVQRFAASRWSASSTDYALIWYKRKLLLNWYRALSIKNYRQLDAPLPADSTHVVARIAAAAL